MIFLSLIFDILVDEGSSKTGVSAAVESLYLGLLRLQLPPGGQSVIIQRLVHNARQTGPSNVARNVGSYK